MVYLTMAEALEAYKKEYPQNAPQVESSINRVLLRSFGLSPSGARMTAKEQEKAAQLLKSQSLPDYARPQWEDLIETSLALTGLEKNKQRYSRFYLKRFVDFICQKSQSINQNCAVSAPNVLKRKKVEPFVDRSYLEAAKPPFICQEPIALKFDVEWYLQDYQGLFPEKSLPELSHIIQDHLTRIHQEIDNVAIFLSGRDKNRLERVSLKNWSDAMKLLLGWLYQKRKNLEQVSLSSLITVVDSNIVYHDYSQPNDYFYAKGKVEYEAKVAATKDLKLFKSFLTEYGKNYAGKTKKGYAGHLINLAKYLYRDITDESEAANYEDIAVIRKLRSFVNQVPSSPKKVAVLCLTWEEILQVRAEIKKRVDDHLLYSINSKGKVTTTPRKISGLAKDLQLFLAYCFLTVIPPIRIRSIAELKIGQTLKYGLFNDRGFTPKEHLPNPLEAKYYYHFLPSDYKTGKSYGEFIAELPNQSFGDGTYFYGYLNQWIEGEYRRYFMKDGQQHNSLFVSTVRGKKYPMGAPIKSRSLSAQISNVNHKYTKVRVGPHTFRKIYRTHLKNTGASSEELRSAAFFMQHSEEIAEKVYTVQTLADKLNPILNLIARFN